MGNILGEGFPPEIVNQVKQRQKVYGSGYTSGIFRSPQEILYLNANSAWCKLVSSTNIINPGILNNKGIKGLGSGLLLNNNLAKEFVLFNGTSYQTTKTIGNQSFNVSEMRGGIDFTNSLTGNRKAYGMGGNEFGINPMPGVISATIKHKNRGSIRAATVNIKAWNKVQFEIIDVLYLRLGFSVLLEWGNTMYFNNKGELEKGELEKNISNSLADSFLNGGISYLDFLSYIQQRRKQSQGNYDAMFAKVTNFHWSFQPDGSYDIILDLISAGDIIESFKINRTDTNAAILDPSSTNSEDTDPSSDTSNINQVLAKYSTTSNIANFLYKTSTLFYRSSVNKGVSEIIYSFGSDQSLYLYNINNKTNFNPTNPSYISPNNIHNNSITENIKTKDAVLVVPPDRELSKASYFIRLGCLLKYIEEGVMYQIKQKNNNTPLLKFDYDVETNLMHAPPQLMSYDPFICMVTREVGFPGISSPEIETRTYFSDKGIRDQLYYNSNIGDPFQSDKNTQWGKIMNIYINFRYILTKLDELKNVEDNSVVLIDFLQNILSGINSALGGFSKLDIFIDEETNFVKIIDKNPLPNSKDALKYAKAPLEYALFELYGYSTRSGEVGAGFIKDFKFTTELTPDFSTMITVGATSQGNVVGENNTALSKLNLGLQDRFKEEINDVTATDATTVDLKTKKDQAYKNFTEFVKFQLKPYLDHLYDNIYIRSEAETNKQAAKTYFDLYKEYRRALDSYIIGKDIPSESLFQPGTGFIPFNLSLTMDGLSGMKIGSKFLIDTSYLPSNYPQTVDFLIKNIQHEIKDNKWTTTLESYCIAQGTDIADIPEREANLATATPSSTSGTDFNVTPTYNNPTKKQIIDKYGWPIILSSTSPQYTSKVISVDSGGRNFYQLDPNYVKNNLTNFNYKGKIILSNIHKDVVNPLTKVLTNIEKAGLLEQYAKNIQANIYTRDTTGAPGNLSGHAFGLSIDVNPDRFPYGQSGYNAYQAAIKDSKNKDHNYAQVIKIIADSGEFYWGGNFNKTKDAHHFTLKPYNI